MRLVGFRDVGVGVAERRVGGVLGEEREYRAGALRAAGNVVFLEDLILAVTASNIFPATRTCCEPRVRVPRQMLNGANHFFQAPRDMTQPFAPDDTVRVQE